MTPERPRSALGKAMDMLVLLALGLAGGGLMALSPDIAVPLTVLMLPGLVTLLLDRSPGSALARAVLLFEGAASVNPIVQAWYRCSGIHDCMQRLCSPTLILRVWLAACLAFLVAQILPIGLKLLEDHRLRIRRAVLQERRAALIEEWGLEEADKA